MNWTVYFLRLSNGNIYVGSTNNVDRRIKEHEAGRVRSTASYTPVELVSFICIETEAHARELERYFKSGSGRAFAKKRLIKPSE